MYVIRQDELISLGVNTIAEALRVVPGVHVQRVNAHSWAISARGGVFLFSNKLLVLIDGRTVYNSLFSGVFWDVHNHPVENIDRIEIIRGPGASVWGANAVNGVINIITKHSGETLGKTASVGVGTVERGLGFLNYGTSFEDESTIRIFAHDLYMDALNAFDGSGSANDHTNRAQVGFRYDSAGDSDELLRVSGDVYRVDSEEFLVFEDRSSPDFTGSAEAPLKDVGGHLLVDYRTKYQDKYDITLRSYIDAWQRDTGLGNFGALTFDFEGQVDTMLADSVSSSFGVGWRLVEDSFSRGTDFNPVSFDPAVRQNNLFSLFSQLSWDVSDDFVLTAGAKLEHNRFTDYEFEPSLRFLYKLTKTQRLWAAASRAIRIPSRFNIDVTYNSGNFGAPGTNILAELRGQNGIASENLYAYEVGYRTKLGRGLSLDVASYYNRYDDLNLLEPSEDIVFDPSGGLITPIFYTDGGSADSYGFEVSAIYQPYDWIRTYVSASRFKIDVKSDLPKIGVGFLEGVDPEWIVSSRTNIDIGLRYEIDFMYYYVSRSEGAALLPLGADPYHRFDVRLEYHPINWFTASILYANIGHNEYRETGPQFGTGIVTRTPQSIFGRLRFNW